MVGFGTGGLLLVSLSSWTGAAGLAVQSPMMSAAKEDWEGPGVSRAMTSLGLARSGPVWVLVGTSC